MWQIRPKVAPRYSNWMWDVWVYRNVAFVDPFPSLLFNWDSQFRRSSNKSGGSWTGTRWWEVGLVQLYISHYNGSLISMEYLTTYGSIHTQSLSCATIWLYDMPAVKLRCMWLDNVTQKLHISITVFCSQWYCNMLCLIIIMRLIKYLGFSDASDSDWLTILVHWKFKSICGFSFVLWHKSAIH